MDERHSVFEADHLVLDVAGSFEFQLLEDRLDQGYVLVVRLGSNLIADHHACNHLHSREKGSFVSIRLTFPTVKR